MLPDDKKFPVVEALPETHKPPDNIEFPETKSWVMLVVAWVEVATMFKVEPR